MCPILLYLYCVCAPYLYCVCVPYLYCVCAPYLYCVCESHISTVCVCTISLLCVCTISLLCVCAPYFSSYSRHSYIADYSQGGTLPDGSPCWKDFSQSRNNRFLTAEGTSKNRIVAPGKILHFYNGPPDSSDESVREVGVCCSMYQVEIRSSGTQIFATRKL